MGENKELSKEDIEMIQYHLYEFCSSNDIAIIYDEFTEQNIISEYINKISPIEIEEEFVDITYQQIKMFGGWQRFCDIVKSSEQNVYALCYGEFFDNEKFKVTKEEFKKIISY